jgi:hypothetical protein
MIFHENSQMEIFTAPGNTITYFANMIKQLDYTLLIWPLSLVQLPISGVQGTDSLNRFEKKHYVQGLGFLDQEETPSRWVQAPRLHYHIFANMIKQIDYTDSSDPSTRSVTHKVSP